MEPEPDPSHLTPSATDPSSRITLPATAPARIGRYHIKRLLAVGGMGLVYEATQEEPRRVVALKVMKRGVTSKAAQRRFEYESQVLSRLRHPGVAQVYEAGIHPDPGGPLPYFAMEYVPNAKSITEYARHRQLAVGEKLELFIRVCEAIHHGHQKGVIHRDLKPANILVDAQGDVKVIDFGVARSTDSDLAATTQQTAVGEMIGTLKYMSPEQCEADPHDIDTRSDVYALGVVLYELLSGRMPYNIERTPAFELPRVIREVAATRLGTFDPALRGDVEIIVDKALEKDRHRRYQSAVALAEDLQRFLNDEPIQARPPSMGYRLAKFIRRRRPFVIAAAVVFLALALAVWFRLEAQAALREREAAFTAVARAQEHARRAKDAATADRLEQASELCDQALALDPANSLALRTKAFVLLEGGEFDRALRAYNQGLQPLEEERALPEDFHNRGRLRMLAADFERAERDHDRAVALRPDVGRLYVSRAVTRRLAGNVDGSIEDLERGASLDRTWGLQCNLWIWEMRMLRGSAGDREAAAAALDAARSAASKDSFDQHYVGICRGELPSDDALAAARTDEQRFFMHYYLGAKALVDGRREEAKAWFEKCLTHPVYRYSEFELARWHLQKLRDSSQK